MAVLPLLLLAYLLVASLLSAIFPLHSLDTDEAGVDVLLVSNGLHVDLGLPLHHPDTPPWVKTAQARIDPVQHGPSYDHVLLGWGDRNFYLNTPRWSDMRLANAWEALFGSEASVVHAVFIRSDWLQDGYRKLRVSDEQYRELIAYLNDAVLDGESLIGVIDNQAYGGNDVFLQSKGRYNAFLTCNAWLGRALHHAHVTDNPWTPLAWNLVDSPR